LTLLLSIALRFLEARFAPIKCPPLDVE